MIKKDELELKFWKTADMAYHRAKLSQYLWAFGFYRQTGSILEIGTGPLNGVLPLLVAKTKVAVEPLFAEYKQEGLLEPDPGIQYVIDYFEKWDTKQRFDAIFSIDSLDHGEMGFHMLPKIFNLLNPGGRFYLHIHLRPADLLNLIHDHQMLESDLNDVLVGQPVKELKRDYYEKDIDGFFCKAIVAVWEKL